jgi:hypothetical protein
MYNLTSFMQSETMSDVALAANELTNFRLFGFFIVAVFLVLLLALKRYDFDDAIITSSFICFLLSGFLAMAEIVNFLFPLFFIMVLSLMLFVKWMTK